jgi:splicing factor 1
MKLDQSSVPESRQAKPSSAPRLSIFGAKAGFFIPKNKLAGSLVIRGSSTKNETPTISKEEQNKHVQRKTKWAPDLSLESAVCKSRALAYQVPYNSLLVSSITSTCLHFSFASVWHPLCYTRL